MKEDRVRAKKQPCATGFSLLHILIVGFFIFFAMVIGVGIGVYSNYMWALTEHSEADNQYVIDGWKITFLPGDHPKMEGVTQGFTVMNGDKAFYIERGHSLDRVEVICNHELMHAMGVGPEYHDFIYGNHDRVDSSVCNELRDRVAEDRNMETPW